MKHHFEISICILIALAGCAVKTDPPHATYDDATRGRIESEPVPIGYNRFYVCGGERFFKGNKNESPKPWAGAIGPFAIHELEFPQATEKSRLAVINQDELAIFDLSDDKQVEVFEITTTSKTILHFLPKSQTATNVRINVSTSTEDRLQYLDLSGIYSAAGVGGKYMNDTYPRATGSSTATRRIQFEITDDPQTCSGKRLVYYGKF